MPPLLINMDIELTRTKLLLGDKAVEKLASARVAVFGIGGVGGYVVEALARSGVGAIDLVDDDKVSATDLNRQIYATHKTLNMYKADVATARIADINPGCKVRTHKIFFLPETQGLFDFGEYDYVVDAIDTVSGKLALIAKAKAANVPVISAMGAGNKLDPTAFEVADIYKTSVCPLAKVMRRELKKLGIMQLKVVYSKEQPCKAGEGCDADVRSVDSEKCARRRAIPGSVSFVPPVMGFIIAGEVIKDLIAM